MWRNNSENLSDELFMDALSDCSEGNDMRISDYEFSEDDGICSCHTSKLSSNTSK